MENATLFKNYMTLLGEIHGKAISDTLKTAYWEILEEYTDDQCHRAFDVAIKTCKFFPKPAELIEFIEGPSNNKATEAWIKVDQAVKRVGNYASVRFDDPAIHSCIEVMGGWEALGQTSAHEWKWKQKEFEKLYSIMSRRQEHPDVLLGLCDRQNITMGFRKAPENIVQIGGSKDDLVSLPDAGRPEAGPEPVAPKRRVGAGPGQEL